MSYRRGQLPKTIEILKQKTVSEDCASYRHRHASLPTPSAAASTVISSGPTCAHRAAGCPMPRRSVLIVFDSIIQARALSQARDGKNKCDCVSKTTLRAQKQEMENRCDIASKTGLHTQTKTVKTCHFSLSVRPVCLFETHKTSGRAPVVVTRVGQDIRAYFKA